MGIDVTNDERRATGKLVFLPLHSLAGEQAALRTELLARLHRNRAALVDDMVRAVHRAGLIAILQTGDAAAADRLDAAAGMVLDAWEHGRPLHPADLDALRVVGREVAAAGVPFWRLLSAVHQAAMAGWQVALQLALSLGDGALRPGSAAQLVGELSAELLQVLGRLEAQLAAGYAETGTGSGTG